MDYEIIVVNNNSKDETERIARQYTKKVYNEKKQGYIYAVNTGAKLARGKYISICDADTSYPDAWLSKIDLVFRSQDGLAGIYGGIKINDSNFILNSLGPIFYNLFLLISRAAGLDNTSGFNFVFKKEVYDKAGGYGERYTKASPDIELGKRMKKFGKIRLDLSINVFASTRRFRKKGYIRTIWMYLKLWIIKVFNKEPEMSYTEYNA